MHFHSTGRDSREAFEQMYDLKFEMPTFGAGHSKRHGIVFMERPAPIESRVSTESDGIWEYCTRPPTSTRPVPAYEGTEAQRIATTYRMKSTDSANSERTMVTPPPTYSVPLSMQNSTSAAPKEKPYTSVVKFNDDRISNDPDRQRGLIAVFNEAMDAANKQQQSCPGNEHIPCPRAGCGGILPDLHRLMCHLHLHDIDKNIVACRRCKASYDQNCDMHRCEKSARLPLLGGLLRVLAKITSHSNTA